MARLAALNAQGRRRLDDEAAEAVAGLVCRHFREDLMQAAKNRHTHRNLKYLNRVLALRL